MKLTYTTTDYVVSGALAALIPPLITLLSPFNLGLAEAPLLTFGLLYLLLPLVYKLRLSTEQPTH